MSQHIAAVALAGRLANALTDPPLADRLKSSPIRLIPAAQEVSQATLEEMFADAPHIFACDFNVVGLEHGHELPYGYARGRIIGIDHHFSVPRMARQICSGNLAIEYIRQEGIVQLPNLIVIHHTDCDSILTSLMLAGVLPPEERFGEAVIAADHTGEPNPIADLLQVLHRQRDLAFSCRNLDLLLKGQPLEPTAQTLIERRREDRTYVEQVTTQGRLRETGGIYYFQSARRFDTAFLVNLVPEALAFVIATPNDSDPGHPIMNVRLGKRGVETGLNLHSIPIKEFDPKFGGRWNAGSNSRSGGTHLKLGEYVSHFASRVLPDPAPEQATVSVVPTNEEVFQLELVSHDRDPLCTLIRQGMIFDLLERINLNHSVWLEEAAGELGIAPDDLTKALCIKGGATLPPNLRKAHDIDVTIAIGHGYSPTNQVKVVPHIVEYAATRSKSWYNLPVVVEAPISSPLLSDVTNDLSRSKLLKVFYVLREIVIGDMRRIKKNLARLFDFPPEELKLLNEFGEERIGKIIDARRARSERSGFSYVSTPNELTGTGLIVGVAVEVASREHLNYYVPYTMGPQGGKFRMAFTSRKGPREKHLSFLNPQEEVAGKLFALLTNPERARLAEPHARDLIDLYIRTRPEQFPDRSFAPFQPNISPQEINNFMRIAWAAHPAFHADGLHFKKLDPLLGPNLKQVRNGLLASWNHGIIGLSLFGEAITEQNADQYAMMLLQHTWKLCEQFFGVRRSGSNKSPEYRLELPTEVEQYWNFCRKIPTIMKRIKSSGSPRNVVLPIEARLKTLIHAMIGGKPTDPMIVNGEINAFVNADPGRKWVGMKE